jgi:hypothetical protein
MVNRPLAIVMALAVVGLLAGPVRSQEPDTPSDEAESVDEPPEDVAPDDSVDEAPAADTEAAADDASTDDAAVAEGPESPGAATDEAPVTNPAPPPEPARTPAPPPEPARTPAPPPETRRPRFSVETTPIGDIARDPQARAVLERILPQMPQYYDQVGNMTISQLTPISQGALDDARLREIQAAFDKLP